MTNYNERLDEIFNTLPVHGIISSDGIRDDYWDAVNARTKLKQALPSLIKELVAEAKPSKKHVGDEVAENRSCAGERLFNATIDEYHTNLLIALEEK